MSFSHLTKWVSLICISFFILACGNPPAQTASESNSSTTYETSFEYQELSGLSHEEGITRRDPSDIIEYEGVYYVWYTKTSTGFSGYDASVWYAVSSDGMNWEEKGEALPRGEEDTWDSYSVFTPNILKAEGKFYLFYTGVQPTPGNEEGVFENNSVNDITAIGVAVADSPDGPFVRVGEKPALETSVDTLDFDSYRVDDACLIARDGGYWLYYKGRSLQYGEAGPRHTRIGVAFADQPEGAYQKYKGNPITNGGHEVMVWPTQEGVMTLLSAHGEEGKTLQLARDGLHFEIVGRFGDDYPRAPGSFRIDDFMDEPSSAQGISWGISMHYGNQKNSIWPHLKRYSVKLTPISEE